MTSAVFNLVYDNSNNVTSIQAPSDGGSLAAPRRWVTPSAAGTQADYRPNSKTDPQGNTNTYGYNAAGNTITTTQPTGGGTSTNKNQGDAGVTSCGAKTGQVCQVVDARGKITSYGYDANGNVTSITPPSPVGATTIAPDSRSRSGTVTDGKGQATIYTYDKLDRITQIRYGGAATCTPSSGNCITYAYDANGNLLTRVDNTGTTTFSYDALNRALTKAPPAGATTVTYDAVGNVATYNDFGGTITYGYDNANRPASIAMPGGSCPVGASVPNATNCSLMTYDSSGRRSTVKYANGIIQTLTYDKSGRQKTSTTVKSGGGTITSGTYAYTKLVGGVTKDTAVQQSATVNGTATTYTYDPLNRLTTAVRGATTWAYTYDASGNRTQSAKTGAATTYASYNDANQLCWTATATDGTCSTPPAGASGFTYDANGNMLTGAGRTFTYNTKNQTASAGNGGYTQALTYADAASDELTKIGSSTNLTNGLLGLTQNPSGSGGMNVVRIPGSGEVFATRTSGTFFNIKDPIGTTTTAVGAGGTTTDATYTYDPYGDTTTSGTGAGRNSFTFASGQTFTQPGLEGLIKYGTRYYLPTLGIWTQQDPIAGTISNPATLNPYTYAGGDPINMTDPTGRSVGSSVILGIGAVGTILGGVSAVLAAPLWGAALVASAFVGTIGGMLGGVALIGGIGCEINDC